MCVSDPHLIWMIEDDIPLAEVHIALLESLQYKVVHSSSAAEAREIMPTITPCAVLLDLGLRATPKSIVSPSLTLATGEKIGCEIRELHPARNALDKHLLQIIATTGHDEAKNVKSAVRIMQTMADDFLTKGDPQRRIDDAIRRALRHAGRESHETCLRIDSRQALTLPPPAAGATSGDAPRKTIHLTNRKVQRNVEVLVDGRAIAVAPAVNKRLLGLAVGRHRGRDISRDELGDGASNANGPSRLRTALDDKEIVVCSDGGVRLDERVAITVDLDAFAGESDRVVKAWIAELRKAAKKTLRNGSRGGSVSDPT